MEIFDLVTRMNGETISVISILLLAIFLGIKAFIKVWEKHEVDMKTLKAEYIEILKGMKEEHKENVKAHKEAMELQRQEHLEEKTRFFGGLNATLSQLVKELQISNEVRNKISFDMAEIKSYQAEVRQAIDYFKTEQEKIKHSLYTNGEKLAVLLKYELNENSPIHKAHR